MEMWLVWAWRVEELAMVCGMWRLAAVAAVAMTVSGGTAFGQRGGRGGGRGGGGQQMPRVNPAIVQDQQALQAAMAEQTKAQAALDEGVKKAQKEFEGSADMTVAQKAATEASAEQTKVRETVLAKLKTNSSYKAAADKVAAADKKVADLQAKHASPDAIAAASSEAFKLSAVTSKMERDALDGDPDYAAAKGKVLEANKAVVDLRKTFNDGLKDSEALKPLRDAKDAAVAKVTEAQDKLRTDMVAGR
jgi:hypothetical protein